MKKALFIAALALGSLAATAQTLQISTYQGTDITKYDGQTRNVIASRFVLNGWNTISLPFAVTADQLNQVFGADCRLERLAGIETNGSQTTLNFVDCKAEGIKAGMPYILYYSGESAVKNLKVENAQLKKAPTAVTFSDINGMRVTFAPATKQRTAKGVYGILAKDNADAAFVNVNNDQTALYATRCFITLSGDNQTQLLTNHLTQGEATAITSILRAGEKADVYSVNGAKVAHSLDAHGVSQLPAGIYVVKGRKTLVK